MQRELRYTVLKNNDIRGALTERKAEVRPHFMGVQDGN